jgi:fluoroacetyl-CoA thioesterase
MKPTLKPGLSRAGRVVVDRRRTVGFMGEASRVYGTPSLVHDIEDTCRDLLLEHVDAGEDSVGMDIAVRQTAPTLLGMAVEISVTVTAVEGRKVSFEVTAKDEIEPIGGGTHNRFVVDVGKTQARLQAKAARRPTASSA